MHLTHKGLIYGAIPTGIFTPSPTQCNQILKDFLSGFVHFNVPVETGEVTPVATYL